MSAIRSFLLFLFLSSLAAVAAADDLTPQKRADIERLLEMTGATRIGKQLTVFSAGAMVQSLKERHPEIPQKTLDALPEEVGVVFDAHIGTFMAAIVPLYHRYFTADEIKGMIGFYSTPLGQKAINSMPGLMSESMAIAQEWGQGLNPLIAERVRERLKKEGIEL